MLRRLDQLKDSIDRALRNAKQGGGRQASVHGELQMDRNLRDLAHAAKHFHSAASSSAGSSPSSVPDDGGSTAPWQSYPGAEISLFGDFTDDRRRRVMEFVQDGSPLSAPESQSLPEPKSKVPRLTRSDSMTDASGECEMERDEEEEEDEDDDAQLELDFLRGLQELISYYIRAGNYTKAVTRINDAMLNEAVATDKSLLRTLRIQIVVCHLLQGNWRLASNLLTSVLARAKKDRDAVVCSLLHALAIAHLAEYDFDEALSICKMALFGKKGLLKKGLVTEQGHSETVGLFATVYDMKGDYVRAEVLRGQLPAGFDYRHHDSAAAFILQDEALRDMVNGDSSSVVPGLFELPTSADPNGPSVLFRRTTTTAAMSPLRERICEHERFENDTAKEVIVIAPSSPCDADDEASPVDTPVSTTPLRRRFTKIFRGSKQRRPVMAGSPVKEEPYDSGYSSASPVESASPSSPWRLFGRSRSKKATREGFKLRTMDRMTRVAVESTSESQTQSSSRSTGNIFETYTLPSATPAPPVEEWLQMPMIAEENISVISRSASPALALAELDSEKKNPRTTTRIMNPDEPSSEEDSSFHSSQVSCRTPKLDTNLAAARALDMNARVETQRLPRSIPSLDPTNLLSGPLSLDLTGCITLMSSTLISIPSLKTPQELDSAREALQRALQNLRSVGGADTTLEVDVQAAITGLQRRGMETRGAVVSRASRDAQDDSAVAEPESATGHGSAAKKKLATRQESIADLDPAAQHEQSTKAEFAAVQESPSEQEFHTPLSTLAMEPHSGPAAAEKISCATRAPNDTNESEQPEVVTDDDVSAGDEASCPSLPSEEPGGSETIREAKDVFSLGEWIRTQLPSPERHKTLDVTAQVGETAG